MGKIEWTDVTWNPVRGCTRISPGCQHCYAEIMAGRFSKPGLWGHGFATEDQRWTGVVSLIPEKLAEPLSWVKPRMCFVNSTSDLFHERLPFEDIAAVYGVMAATPHITYQILTKRPERRREFYRWVPPDCGVEMLGRIAAVRSGIDARDRSDGRPWPLPNVWEGTSVEDRPRLGRIAYLRSTPAALRFLSLEPLLEDLGTLDLSGIGWVIVGGESGHGARPCDITWVRDIVAQCGEAGVAAFVKQLGANPIFDAPNPLPAQQIGDDGTAHWWKLGFIKDKKGGDILEWPEDLRVRQLPNQLF